MTPRRAPHQYADNEPGGQNPGYPLCLSMIVCAVNQKPPIWAQPQRNMDRTLTHDITGVEAPESLWRAAGWNTYANSEQVTKWDISGFHQARLMSQELPLAVAKVGPTKEALVMAIESCRARNFDSQHHEATRELARSLSRYADSLREMADATRQRPGGKDLADAVKVLADNNLAITAERLNLEQSGAVYRGEEGV